MEERLSHITKLGLIGVVFAVMAAVAFGTSAQSASAAGPITSVTVSTSGVATCNGQFSATASVRDVQGIFVPGVPVSFSSNGGTLIASSGVTNASGQASATFQATVFNGNASVTAMAGGISGGGTVFINCGQIAPIAPTYPVNPCIYAGCGGVNCGIVGYGCAGNCGIVGYGCGGNNCGVNYAYNTVYGSLYRPPCLNVGYVNQYGYTNCGGYNLACNNGYLGGIPAKMNLAVSPAIVTCGNAVVTVSANITDALGVPVANGTAVSYSSTIGTISSATTIGGNATTTLLVPANSPAGVAVIRVSAGAATSSTTVQVNCAPAVQQVVVVAQQPAQPSQATVIYRPAPGQYQQPPVIIQRPRQQQPVPYAPPFAPPRTGEVGLADPANLVLGDDSAADQSLVNAWSEAQYGVLDASQYDWVVIPDDSTASSQLAQDLLDSAYGVIDASQVDMVIVGDDSAATTTLVIDVANNPSDYGNA